MHGTNDLDVTLGNPIRPNYPSGVSHTVTCHGLLIDGEDAYSVATPSPVIKQKRLTSRNFLTDVPMCFMNRESVIGFRA